MQKKVGSEEAKRSIIMQFVLSVLRVIYKFYYFNVFVLSLIILFPLLYYYLYNSSRFPKAFSLMRVYALVLLIFAGTRLKIKGVENIPEQGPYIICPNHSSFLDIFCIYWIFKRYFVFIGKKEIEKWPLFHIFYTSGMNILVDRNSKVGDFKAFRRMCHEIDRGNPLVIFPEGTISRIAPALEPFKSGAFALAIQKQIPIVPVTFLSNWKLLQRSGIWKGKAGPGISRVVIHKPIITIGLKKTDLVQLQNEVRAIINSPLTN